MNLKFKRITAKNFMSFKELDFNFEKYSSKTVLITGTNGDISVKNGAGKSTLHNSILFAIYGSVIKELKNTFIASFGISSKEDVRTTIEIESNGINYVIDRSLKGKKRAAELHVYKKNEDGSFEEITRSTMDETQRMIETDIVPCGKDGFLRCVILSADQNCNFFKLNKAAKNAFFESLFELTTYSDMYQKLHRKTLDESSTITAISRTIDNINTNIEKLNRDKEESIKNQNDILELRKELEKATCVFESYRSKNDINTIKNKNIESLNELKKKLSDRIFSDIKNFDDENAIEKVDSDGKIIFDDSSFNRRVESEMKKFDCDNNISVDSNDVIIFDDSEYDELKKKKSSIDCRISNGRKLISDNDCKKNSIEKKKYDIISKAKNLKYKIETMANAIEEHSKITDILCEDCTEKYKKSVSIDSYQKKISDIKKDIETLSSDITDCDVEIEKLSSDNTKYSDAISKMESTVLSLNVRINEIAASRNMIQSQRNSFKNKIISEYSSFKKSKQSERDNIVKNSKASANLEYSSLKNELISNERAIESEIKRLSDNRNNIEYRLKILEETKATSFDAPIKSLESTLEKSKIEFNDINKRIAHYKALEEILKPENIRKSVIPDMLKELNFRICGYLAKMGSNYTCEFDDDFEATFVSPTGDEAQYNNFSAGESMRLSIACCLAFRDFMQVRLNLHPSMLIIDEYIDSALDGMAVNGIMDTIHYMVGTDKITAFIISHRSEVMQGSFDSEIQIVKKNGESKIIE